MRKFFSCVLYFAITGIAAFFLGRILPKKWFRYDRFPYRAFAFEREGKLYEKLGIRKWKDALPDMSRILPGLIPSREMPRAKTPAQVELLAPRNLHCGVHSHSALRFRPRPRISVAGNRRMDSLLDLCPGQCALQSDPAV